MSDRKINMPIGLVKQMIDPLFTKSIRDKQFVIDAFISMLPDYNLEMFLELVARNKYTPVKKGSHVMFRPNRYFFDDYDQDTMIDMGLSTKDDYVYGIVLDDDSYSNDFNPYAHKMKVKIYVWYNNEFTYRKESINTMDLTVVKESDIPYFKIIKNEIKV